MLTAAFLPRLLIHKVDGPESTDLCFFINWLLDQAPEYRRGHSIVLGFVLLAWVLTAANVCVHLVSQRFSKC